MSTLAKRYEDRLATALGIIGYGYDLSREDEFVQAGVELVDHAKRAYIGLGELISFKFDMEDVGEDVARANEIYQRYAAAWGVSRSTLVKARVLADKFNEVERPLDASQTLLYEILAGSETPEEAEAGFDMALAEGWGVTEVRLAKALRAEGLVDDWECPALYYHDDGVWIERRDGTRAKVMRRSDNGAEPGMVDLGVFVLRWIARI